MEGLQRSSETFRRSGSSGLVWEDRFLTEEKPSKTEDGVDFRDMKHSYSVGSISMLATSRSNGGDGGKGGGVGGGQGYQTTGYVEPTVDPPSPKLSGCGFCGAFSKPAPASKKKRSRR